MYGVMLPSGNDAAYLLASFFGQILIDLEAHASDDEKVVLFSEDLKPEAQVMSINSIRSKENPFLARGSYFS